MVGLGRILPYFILLLLCSHTNINTFFLFHLGPAATVPSPGGGCMSLCPPADVHSSDAETSLASDFPHSLLPFTKLSQFDIIATEFWKQEERMHLIIHHSCRLQGWQLFYLITKHVVIIKQTFRVELMKCHLGGAWQCKGCEDLGKCVLSHQPACRARTPVLHCTASHAVKAHGWAELSNHCLPMDCKEAVVLRNLTLTDSWETIVPFLFYFMTSHKSLPYSLVPPFNTHIVLLVFFTW